MGNTSSSSSKAIDIVLASTILLRIDRYMLFILYIMGIIGAILNVITFSCRKIRKNSCSAYFLGVSAADFCIMNLFILMEIITTQNKLLADTIYNTRIWCKLGNYLMFIFPCLSSTNLVLASFDRFCISSLNAKLRKLSQFKISFGLMFLLFLFWTLFGLHIPIAYDRLRDPLTNITRCTVQTDSAPAFVIIDGFFFALYNGAIAPAVLCIFGLLICRNMRLSRQRVVPQVNHGSNQSNNPIAPSNDSRTASIDARQTHLMSLMLVQVLLTVILNTPYIVLYLFAFFNRLPQDSLRFLLYIVFSFIARWFYYLNYCKTFYISTLTSRTFRDSLRKRLCHAIRHCRMRLYC